FERLIFKRHFMIRTQLTLASGERHEGGTELISRWRENTGSFLWMDIQNEPQDIESHWLLEFHCHPLAIEDAQRFRHPPKYENFKDHALFIYRGITEFNSDLSISQMNIALFAGENF